MILSLFLVAGMAAASVTSVDRLEYTSEGSDFWDGPVFIISMTSNYDTNEFNLQLDNDRDLSTLVDPTSSVQNDITVEVENQKTEAVYTLRDTGKKDIHKVEPYTFWVYPDGIPSLDEDEIADLIESNDKIDDCIDISGDGVVGSLDYVGKDGFNGWDYGYKVYCLQKGEPLGNVGEISSDPNDVFSTNWVVKNDEGVIDQAVISNGDMGNSVTQQLGQNVKIQFEGSASTGRNSPVPTDELVLQKPENTGYKIIQRDNYRDYRNSFDVLSRIKEWAKGQGVSGEEIASNINAQATDAATQHSSSEFLPGSDTDNDGNTEVNDISFTGSGFENGELRLEIDDLVFPRYQIAARACRKASGETCNAMVQIEKSVGEPSIVGTAGDEFTELQQGEITLTYENVGDSEGSFEATVLECKDPLTFAGISQRASLEPGETHTDSFVISGDSSDDSQTDYSRQCTFQVKETNTGETASASVNVDFSQKSTCTPGERFRMTGTRNGEVIYSVYECNDQGTNSELVKQCGEGEIAKPQTGNEYLCVAQGDDTDTSTNPGQGCSPITLVSNPLGNDLKMPNVPCQVKNAVDVAWTGVKAAAALFSVLLGFRAGRGLVTILELNAAINARGREIPVKWIVGALFGVILGVATLAFLSNPVVKWSMIIGGIAVTLIYIRLFGFSAFVKTLTPL